VAGRGAHLHNISVKAASALAQYVAVRLDTATDNQALVASSSGFDVLGIVAATAATYGNLVPVTVLGVEKALCVASVGAGARVGVASTNGGLGPIVPTGAAASGAARTYAIGRSLMAAAPGTFFSVLIDPEQFA
jgi:hypothetical protein